MTATHQQSVADINPLVISDSKWKQNRIDEICQESEADGIEKLKQLGYVLVKHGKNTFLIAPTIWQQDQMDRMLDVYKRIASDLKEDGTLDLNNDSVARDFVQAAFGGDGSEVGPDTSVGVGTHRTYDISVGDRSISVRGGSTSKFSNSSLGAHPVGHQNQPAAFKIPLSGYRPMWPHEYVTLGFHGILADGRRRMEAFQEAIELIKEHFNSFDQLRQQARRKLGDVVGGDQSKTVGKGFAGLPRDMQDDLRNELTNNFGSYGFGSAADALAFLNGSTLSGVDSGIMLTVGLGSYNGTPQFHGKEIP